MTLTLDQLQFEFEDYLLFATTHDLAKRRQSQYYYADPTVQELWQTYQECYLMMQRKEKKNV